MNLIFLYSLELGYIWNCFDSLLSCIDFLSSELWCRIISRISIHWNLLLFVLWRLPQAVFEFSPWRLLDGWECPFKMQHSKSYPIPCRSISFQMVVLTLAFLSMSNVLWICPSWRPSKSDCIQQQSLSLLLVLTWWIIELAQTAPKNFFLLSPVVVLTQLVKVKKNIP